MRRRPYKRTKKSFILKKLFKYRERASFLNAEPDHFERHFDHFLIARDYGRNIPFFIFVYFRFKCLFGQHHL